jgi:hypothetical protein
MHRYCAAVSTSSQRGSMIGPGATSLGSMVELLANCRGCCREGPNGCRPGAETTGIVGAALGFSGSVDGSGQGLELTSVSALSGIGLLEWRLTAARKHAVGGACAPPRHAARGRGDG